MDLKFDKMTVDTTLAKDYLQREKQLSEICNSGIQDVDVFYDGEKFLQSFNFDHKLLEGSNEERLEKLAVKLKENTNLFTQLEYLLRDIPIEDTKAQINLIIQQINYVASKPWLHVPINPLYAGDKTSSLQMGRNTPLYVLGYIAKITVSKNFCWIHTDKSCAAVCHLFTKICNDAGLAVCTKFQRDTVCNGDQFVPEGAVGVISELSDIDSAVDVFLSSSQQVPWRLRRILIQESVYQQFKNAITWKCNLNKQRENRSDTSSSDLVYAGRAFFIDPVHIPEPHSTAVCIEAYRTRKELKSLLNVYNSHFLSLWANDVAEINEIAHGVLAPVVWVNNFGDFRGPPKVSEAVYPCVFAPCSVPKDKTICELFELKQSWLNLDFGARRDILCRALDKCLDAESGMESLFRLIRSDLREIDSNTPGAFIDIGKDYVWLGKPAPSNKVFIRERDVICPEIFKSVLLGNAFAITDQQSQVVRMVKTLREARVPVVSITRKVCETSESTFYICDCEETALLEVTQVTKVISTNSGTTFAN